MGKRFSSEDFKKKCLDTSSWVKDVLEEYSSDKKTILVKCLNGHDVRCICKALTRTRGLKNCPICKNKDYEMKTCLNCNKILNKEQEKFCSQSCSATFNNLKKNENFLNSINDELFKEAIQSSKTLLSASKKLGFKYTPHKKIFDLIESRMENLNVFLLDSNNKKPIFITYENSKEVGFVGEKYFEYECAKNRIPFYKETSENKPFDYLIDINDSFKKIQVKTIEMAELDGSMTFKIKHGSRGNLKAYNNGDFDYLYLFCIENQKSFLVDFRNKKMQSSITINKNEDLSFNQILEINMEKIE